MYPLVNNCNMITLEQVRKKLAEEIRNSKMTQKELAERIGVSRPQISHYVHGKKMPALDTFANLCVVLDVDPADILCTNQNQ